MFEDIRYFEGRTIFTCHDASCTGWSYELVWSTGYLELGCAYYSMWSGHKCF